MRVAVVCTVSDGGMVHFAQSCFRAIAELGKDAMVIFPQRAAVDLKSLEAVGRVCVYDDRRGISNGFTAARSIASHLEAFSPDSIWFTDETITSAAVRAACENPVIFIHDVRPHLVKMSVKSRLRFLYLLMDRRRAIARASRVVVMSNTARDDLLSQYGDRFYDRVSVLRLGATAPNCSALVPPELDEAFDGGFFLFFGAIEKYKNVEGLVRAFSSLLTERPFARLIIAGRGAIEEKTLRIIKQHHRSIVLLNRYISDGELAYLMMGARATLLPYLEATQSGVLPISYSFGKPVVTSDAPGLSEFVVDGVTGFVVKDEVGLAAAMDKLLDDDLVRRMGEAGRAYAKHELDFTGNVAKIISDINGES